MKTRVISSEDFDNQLKDFCALIEKLVKSKSKKGTFSFLNDNSPRTSSSVLLSMMEIKPRNRLENIFKQILVSEIIRAEKISAFASESLLDTFLKIEKLKYSGVNKNLKLERDKNLKNIQCKIRRSKISDLENIILENFPKMVSSIVLESLRVGGISTKIKFQHSNIDVPIIEQINSYSFNVIPDINVVASHDRDEWEREEINVICIEGFIEKVSEIDCVLSLASQEKVPLLIVALGFSSEVISTIVLNNKRKTFDVMLCTPEQTQESVNDLGDIASVTGSKFYGYQTGPLSTSFDPEDFDQKIKKAKVENFDLTIENTRTKKAVQKRVSNIKKSLGESDIKDDYLRKRIDSLTSSQVIINLPEKSSQSKFNEIEQFDLALRTARSLISFGVSKDGSFPAASIYAGTKLGYDLFDLISSIKSAVIFDD